MYTKRKVSFFSDRFEANYMLNAYYSNVSVPNAANRKENVYCDSVSALF